MTNRSSVQHLGFQIIILLKYSQRNDLNLLKLNTQFFQRSKTQQSSGNAEVQMDVTDIIHTASSCEDKTSLLLKIVKTGIDAISPLQSKFIHITEPPWINSSLKSLIRKRQSALNQGDLKEFHHLRNRVNPERKICRAKYYE